MERKLFTLPSGDYKKQIIKTINLLLPDSVAKPLIWTIETVDFGQERYWEIILNIPEYNTTLKFMTEDYDGISFEQTLPQLLKSPAPKRNWFDFILAFNT